MSLHCKQLFSGLASLVLCLVFAASALAAIPDGDYTLTVYKFNSDGTTTEVESTSLTASGGTASFSLSSIPTHPDTNFLYFTLTDGTGTIVRRAVAPAPLTQDTTELGITELSSAQGRAMLSAGQIVGTDDPILVSFLMVLLRVTDSEIQGFEDDVARLGQEAILNGAGGENSFIQYLQAQGVTDAQLDDFRSELVHSTVSGGKDLGDYSQLFKQAVDQSDDEVQYEAGGLMGEIFMAAAQAAGIDAGLILAAHNQAGVVAGLSANYAALAGSSLQTSMDQSMTSFFMRIKAAKNNQTYNNALDALNATGTQADQYSNAVNAFLEDQADVEKQYGEFFSDPDAYLAANSTTANAVQAALDAAYNAAFTTFETALRASDADITAMKQNVASALGIAVGALPAGFGTIRDFNGNDVNWPVTYVIVVNWLADIITNGGGLTYNRANVSAAMAVPGNMGWLNGTGNRGNYDTSVSLEVLQAIQEDVLIAEFTMYDVFDDGTDPNMAQERDAKEAFSDNIELILNNMGGTSDGSTALTTAQKKAILTLMQQPSLF